MANPISRDPEHLKIPAFMRTRELTKRSKNKLEMTALDRREKGVLPNGVTRKTADASRPTLIEDERLMRAEARMEKMRATGQMDKIDARQRTSRREAYQNSDDGWSTGTVNQNDIQSSPGRRPTKLPSMSDHANRRPSNMWEIAIAEIHKEKHPDARVVPQLTPRARRQTREYDQDSEPRNSTEYGRIQPQEKQTRRTQQSFESPLFDDAQTTRTPSDHRYETQRMAPQPDYSYQPASNPNNAYYRPDRQTRLSHELQNAPTKQGPNAQTLKAIGEVTQVYGKINVAVLRLDDQLSVGDTITYQTPDGSHTQTVLSMEIDRKPIFKANIGDEVGIKLYKTALVGKVVYMAGTT